MISSKTLQSTLKYSQDSVWTNTFQMDLHANTQIYMLSLKVKPMPPSEESFIKEELLKIAAKTLEKLTGAVVFPTGDVVYCLKPLKSEEVEVATHEKGYVMVAIPTNQTFLLSEKSQEANRLLSVVLKNYMEKAGYAENGKRSCYFNNQKQPYTLHERGISVMPGFKMHIDRYLDGLIRLNIDTVFRISSTYPIYNELHDAITDARDKDGAKAKFISENIIGKSFSVKNDMKKMVLIHGVDSKVTFSSPSPVAGYSNMRAYLEDKFKHKLTKSDQPILFNEKKRKLDGLTSTIRTHYPSEILYALGLKNEQKKDFRLMNELAEFTKHKPDEKKSKIMDFSKSLKMICNEIGLKMSEQPKSSMKCKVLSAPTVEVRNNHKHKCDDGIIFFKQHIYDEAAKLEKFAIVYESDYDFADTFWANLQQEMEKIGAPAKEEPLWLECPQHPTLATYKQLITDAKKEGCTMVILLISKKTGETLYKGIKEFADIKAQVLTQCVKVHPSVNTKRGFFQKLGYQICSKIGYPLWIIEKPRGLEPKEKTIIIGADVYHQKGKESVAAVVSTLDQHYSKFCSVSSVQPSKGQEIMTNMADLVKECIETFKQKNKFLPKRILLYRDGVGDNMFDLVKTHELGLIKSMLEKEYGQSAPKLTMIIVTKRISKKIIKETNQGGKNPASGTILDVGIVQNDLEFFMIAQNVTSGTANPTRYQVLVNECGYDSDALEAMTYYQTFGYYNWSGAVKVPAVCQYAHKLAYHVGENYKQASRFMKQYLYYL
jgi:aubergine